MEMHDIYNIHGLVNDLFGMHREEDTIDEEGPLNQQSQKGPDAEVQTFYNLLKNADQELYPDCKSFSKLSFIIHLFLLKCLNGWSGKSFTMLLELLIKEFSLDETLPKSTYQAKTYLGKLGIRYKRSMLV